jgi:hypothetical protein
MKLLKKIEVSILVLIVLRLAAGLPARQAVKAQQIRSRVESGVPFLLV